ncbi:AAA family ATPase [Heliorestis convoluta]|uniref:AAA family ATPase n=1 Tax=Heliorestis convoluta TaxID=356322 RepID=A0A5Q2N0I3_9FIRM|nr:AAA family ATPase [Heliorestis convoluta]QGG46772.1 AAA family ATPase [Heliorestis convoluta]
MKIRLNINPEAQLANLKNSTWLPSKLPESIKTVKTLRNDKAKEKKTSKAMDNNVREINNEAIEEILKELNSLVGLQEVKTLIHELRSFVEVRNMRIEQGLTNEAMALHMIFKGNPGTGKTTVSRIVGRLFKELGVLPKGHVIEVERADLVGEYIGHTAIRAREQVKKALGGVLFIDEAYSLARGGDKDFGKECVDCLVKSVEDFRDNLIVILSGYKDEMNIFLKTNPGIRSRFPIQLEFPDYATKELLEIADSMVKEREYYLSGEGKLALEKHLNEQERNGHPHRGNARLVRNIIEKSIRRHAVRLLSTNNEKKFSRQELMVLEAQDITEGCKQCYDEKK